VVPVRYPNGTVRTPTVYDITLQLVGHWRAMNVSGYLADYGLAPNLLECVPTYIHRVASFNAANAWMLNNAADIVEHVKGDAPAAAAMRADADGIANAVMTQLWSPEGWWNTLYLNGTLQQVRAAAVGVGEGTGR
jgi:hypothetical protein